MSRKFLTTASFEAAIYGRYGNLSLEEEEQLIAELPAEEVEIQADVNEANRMLEVSDALEDLALIADSIPEASTTDVQLVETAVAVAAGPEVEVNEIVPALESYIGRRISTEGLVETARNIWENIKAWILKAWKQVKDFMYKIFGLIPSQRRKVEAMKKRVEDYAGYKKEENSVTISSGVKYLSVNGTAVKNISAFNAALANWNAVTTGLNDISTAMEAFANAATDAIGEFDVDNVQVVKTAPFFNVMKNLQNSTKASRPSSVEENYDSKDFDVGYTESLLGNVVYQVVSPKDDGRTSVLGNLEKVRRTRVNPVSTVGKNKDADTEVEFTTAGLGDLTKALELCETILDNVEKSKRGTGVEKAEKARDKLKQACDKADARYQKAAKDDKTSKESLAVFKSLLSLNLTTTNLFVSPATSISSNALSAVRATLALVAKNLTAYKKA